MPGIQVKVVGMNKVRNNIGVLDDEIKKKVMDAINKGALVDIETPAKKNCPVDTGRLRSSIHTIKYAGNNFTYKDSKGKVFDGKMKEAKLGKYDIIVGTNVDYAGKIERSKKYLSKAFISGEQKIYKRVKDVLKKIQG